MPACCAVTSDATRRPRKVHFAAHDALLDSTPSSPSMASSGHASNRRLLPVVVRRRALPRPLRILPQSQGGALRQAMLLLLWILARAPRLTWAGRRTGILFGRHIGGGAQAIAGAQAVELRMLILLLREGISSSSVTENAIAVSSKDTARLTVEIRSPGSDAGRLVTALGAAPTPWRRLLLQHCHLRLPCGTLVLLHPNLLLHLWCEGASTTSQCALLPSRACSLSPGGW